MITKRLKGISLFASAGIGETYFKEAGIDIVVSNELLEKRADLYRAIAPETTVVCGDITNEEVFEKIAEVAEIVDGDVQSIEAVKPEEEKTETKKKSSKK